MIKKLRVIELFAVIGSQTQALKNIGVPHKVVAISKMGWNDNQIDKVVKAELSKRHMYMQAGNSIAIPVLEDIFRQLFL